MLQRFLVGLALAAAVAAEQSYQSQGLSFQLPVEFSQPVRAGQGAEELHFPVTGSPSAEILTFVADPEQVKSVAEAGQSVDRHFITTYLGVTGQPEQINKAVIGELGGRHLVYHSQLKRPCRIDVYERDLKGGGFFAVALRSYADLDEKQRINIGESLRKTLSTRR